MKSPLTSNYLKIAVGSAAIVGAVAMLLMGGTFLPVVPIMFLLVAGSGLVVWPVLGEDLRELGRTGRLERPPLQRRNRIAFVGVVLIALSYFVLAAQFFLLAILGMPIVGLIVAAAVLTVCGAVLSLWRIHSS